MEYHVITNWYYRWEFSGNGSIKSEFRLSLDLDEKDAITTLYQEKNCQN